MLVLSIISAAIWAYLIFARGNFWRMELPAPGIAASGRVVAVIPARNEAATVGRTVTSLMRQQFVGLRVVLVDDASTDTTSAVARAAAAAIGMAERLTILKGTPLPDGWTGKLWAMQQGIEHALASAPDFILLTDADIEHDPQSVASLASIAEKGFDLASYMVKLRCESTAERLLIPAFVYFFFQLYPPRWIADTKSKTAGAAGGCMLIRPATLERAGGIASIRGEIIDDCALARAVKRSGGRVWLGPTNSSHSLRLYGTFTEIGRMIARTAFNQLRHSTWLLALTVIGLLLTYVAPIVCVASGHLFAAVLGGTGWAMMTLSYLPLVRYYGLHPFRALTLPFAAVFYLGATVWSALRYWSGRGGEWKGRAQDRNS